MNLGLASRLYTPTTAFSHTTKYQRANGFEFKGRKSASVAVRKLSVSDYSIKEAIAMEATPNSTNSDSDPKPPVIYRCKKCRRIVATEDHILSHERGQGQKSFKWKKRNADSDKEAPECSSIFVEPMKWMQAVEEGCVEDKLQCIGCKARLGSFSWAGMQCNCGAWINPAFQLHKSRLDECRL